MVCGGWCRIELCIFLKTTWGLMIHCFVATLHRGHCLIIFLRLLGYNVYNWWGKRTNCREDWFLKSIVGILEQSTLVVFLGDITFLKWWLFAFSLVMNVSSVVNIDSTTLQWHFTIKLEVSWGSLVDTFLLCRPCWMLFVPCRPQSSSLEVCQCYVTRILSICIICSLILLIMFQVFTFLCINSGLSYHVNEESLREAFSSFGDVDEGES